MVTPSQLRVFTVLIYSCCVIYFSAPSDYTDAVQRFEFDEESLTRQCTFFEIVDNSILEDLESFRLTLTTADTRIDLESEEGMVVIIDNDGK